MFLGSPVKEEVVQGSPRPTQEEIGEGRLRDPAQSSLQSEDGVGEAEGDEHSDDVGGD